MAELVQLHIENTVPELEQMERIGLFSRDEIKKIIRKRKGLEYRLRRCKKDKTDFLKYIEYENNLLNLIKKRRERFGCDFKKKEIDFAIAARINKLFKTVTQRYQDDVELWMSQIAFCKKMKWHNTISGLFMRMLQVHNANPALWVMASQWELDENNGCENARKLLQRGLRYHPKSQQLWLEYFRMELKYTEMIRKRREILGVQDMQDASNEAENDAILDGSIALVVYENATKAIDDVCFALSFLTICQLFDFTGHHIDHIYEDVQARYPDKEETLDALAQRPLLTTSEEIKEGKQKGFKKSEILRKIEEQVLAAYEQAVQVLNTEKMWAFYINFCMGTLHSSKKPKHQLRIRSHVLDVLERAAAEECLSCDDYIMWIRLLRTSGEEEKALATSVVVARKWESNVNLWRLCLSLHIEANKENKMLSLLLNEALNSIPESESFPVWQIGVQWLSLSDPSKLIDHLEKGLYGCRAVSVPLRELYLEVAALQRGIQATRDLYKRLCHLPPLSAEFHKKMIHIENAQLKPSLEQLRKYHEEAVRDFGTTDVDLWMSFIKVEMEHPDGNPNLFNMLYWRALRALTPEKSDEFISRATLFSAGHKSASA